jgi:hypothetical protein
MIDRIGIRLSKSGNALIFLKKGLKLAFPQVTVGSRSIKGRDTLKFFIVKHWDISFAAPAPKNLHGELNRLTP